MNFEHDESGEHMEEGLAKSDAEKSDSPSPKKGGGVAKPKRRGRRGKKRKQRKESGDSEEQEGSRALDPEPPWDSEEEEKESTNYSGQMLRPNAPHAPKNSTQFIIDDHNECRLYMSFETPNPYLTTTTDENRGDISMEPIGEDAAYVDIDYQYESPQDFDNTAYNDREFELSYKSNRFEELLRLPRERLVSGLRKLEQRLKEMSDDLVKENPSPILEKLQHDLLELQEKHCELQEANTRLTALVAQKEGGRTDETRCHEKQPNRDDAEAEEFPAKCLDNDELSSEMDVEGKKLLANDVSIETDAELREKHPSDDLVEKSDLCLSDLICDKQSRTKIDIGIEQSIKADFGYVVQNHESGLSEGDGNGQSSKVGSKGKDCLEGQLSKVGISEQSDCDDSIKNGL